MKRKRTHSGRKRLTPKEKKRLAVFLTVATLIWVGLLACVAWIAMRPAPLRAQPVTTEGNRALVNVAELHPGGVKLFEYEAKDGRTVRFFVIALANGSYGSAFDACEDCKQFDAGFRPENGELVCNHCGERVTFAKLGKSSGGCDPVFLRSQRESSYLIFDKDDLEAGLKFFPEMH